jgi:hypothetical protein
MQHSSDTAESLHKQPALSIYVDNNPIFPVKPLAAFAIFTGAMNRRFNVTFRPLIEGARETQPLALSPHFKGGYYDSANIRQQLKR